MNFKIDTLKDDLGEIQIGDFVELFYMDTSYWNRTQYQQQWEESKKNIENSLPSIFITSVPDPETANMVRRWICYIINDQAVFQEHLLFLDEHPKGRDLEFIKNYIPVYESIDEDGDKISEWKVKI